MIIPMLFYAKPLPFVSYQCSTISERRSSELTMRIAAALH